MTEKNKTFENISGDPETANEKLQDHLGDEVFVFPTSYSQEQLWLLEQLRGERSLYNIAGGLKLEGSLKISALKKALEEIALRQEILRTTFPVIEGSPVQAITPTFSTPLTVVDWQEKPTVQQEEELKHFIEQELRQTFDLAKGPLWGVKLIQLSSKSYVLFLTMHHIIGDGWSIGRFLYELAVLYRAFSKNNFSPLAELEIQYADFAEWQRQFISGETLKHQLKYWEEHLKGAPACINLPTDRPRPEALTYNGKRQELSLSSSLAQSLQTLSQDEGVTLFATLMTALKILLAKYAKQNDLVVGTVIAGRNRAEIEPLIGCFMNFLALRSQINETQTVQDFLKQVSQTVLNAYAQQDCPFEKVVEAINPERATNQNPIYNVALLLHNYPLKYQFDETLVATPIPIDTGSALLDLRFEVFTAADKLLLQCEYSTDLFEDKTVELLLKDYSAILEQMAYQIALPLTDIKLSKKLESRIARMRHQEKEKPTLAMASTFTAEPIEEPVSFWLEKLDLPFQVKFAPYNQVFQELLDPSSLTATNQEGVNILLIRFEDWNTTENQLSLRVDLNQKERLLHNQESHILPNRWEIAHLNQYETDYLYNEIFVDEVYSRNGIIFKEDDCIVDVGANIGMFTLFAQQKCPKGKIYSIEPAPNTFKALQINAALYGNAVKALNCGLGSQNKEDIFTFYPKSSVFSSFTADQETDEEAIRAVIMNMIKQSDPSLTEELANTLVDNLIKERLEQQTYSVQLRTLSDIIEEEGINQIDLLKLDAEKSEVPILQGIKDSHWPMIKQIVMELHEQDGTQLKEVTQLLDKKGFDWILEEETLLQSSGLYTIYATRLSKNLKENQAASNYKITGVEENIQELIDTLKSKPANTTTPFFILCCPPSPQVIASPKHKALFETLEHKLADDLESMSNIYVIKTPELTRLYPVEDLYDTDGDILGHVPYTQSGFTALGTLLARRLANIKSSPYKVIVLDCDQTLWKGVCGEDGAQGVQITEHFKMLQKFMLTQQDQGKIICLCSKNEPEDVFEVFDSNNAMLLQRKDIVSSRINWQPKSENIKSLAEELKLGLDSFIFVDDNPVECAEVRANCPAVLTLQLPKDDAEIPQFLDHIWAFDNLKTTAEDKKRTELYRDNVERERLRKETLTFGDFLKGLNLKVSITPAQPEQLARVAQLTQRTNQFNVTTVRRSESEIQQLIDSDTFKALTVSVKDRFGDYGLVGAVLWEEHQECLKIDTFLLSCRALGKGVEHQMLAHVAKIAQNGQRKWVEVPCFPTEKNRPVRDFLNTVGKQYKKEIDKGMVFKFPAETLVNLVFDPDSKKNENVKNKTKSPTKTAQSPSIGFTSREIYQTIASKFNTVAQIIGELKAQNQWQQRSLDNNFVAPRNITEEQLSQIWRNVLKIDEIGIRDNFFKLGGTSLLAVRLMAQVQKQFNHNLPLAVLFQSQTIEDLANLLHNETDALSWSPLVPIQPEGTKEPFFCIPGAGGNVLYFYELARLMHTDRPFYGLQPLGLDGTSLPHERVEDMASYYIEAIRSMKPHGPYVLGGHSFGSHVALEMAQQLLRQGEKVALLAVFDAPAPVLEAPTIANDDQKNEAAWLIELAEVIEEWLGKKLAITYDDIAQLDHDDQLTYFKECLQQIDLLPAQSDISQVRGLINVFKANHQANYSPQESIDLAEIVLFKASELTEYQSDTGSTSILEETTWGWNKFSQEVKTFVVPGNHMSMLAHHNVDKLARQLCDQLDELKQQEETD